MFRIKGAIQTISVCLFEYFRFLFTPAWSKSPIIVLSPGKEGSSSVYESLRNRGGANVYHLHYVDRTEILKSMKIHLQSERKSIPRHLFTSWFCAKRLEKFRGKVHLILLVRHPIDRLVSSVYQNLDRYGISHRNIERSDDKIEDIIKSTLSEDYFEYLDNWFEREVKEHFGIDVFAGRHGLAKPGHFDVTGFCMRMEDLDDKFKEFYKKAFQTDVELLRRNVGADKFYNESYRRLKSKMSLNTSFEDYPDSQYFKLFYGQGVSRPFFFIFGK